MPIEEFKQSSIMETLYRKYTLLRSKRKIMECALSKSAAIISSSADFANPSSSIVSE